MNEELDHDTVAHGMQPEDTPELRALYKGFEEQSLIPLWTQLGDLMPTHPKSKAVSVGHETFDETDLDRKRTPASEESRDQRKMS